MVEGISTTPNPDTVRALKGRVRWRAGIGGKNDYAVEVSGAKKVVTVSKFRSPIVGTHDSWTSRVRDREPAETNPQTGEENFPFTELSVRVSISTGDTTLVKKSGVLRSMNGSSFIPVSNPGELPPTEGDFHDHLVVLANTNRGNRLSLKKGTTRDERRAARKTGRKS